MIINLHLLFLPLQNLNFISQRINLMHQLTHLLSQMIIITLQEVIINLKRNQLQSTLVILFLKHLSQFLSFLMIIVLLFSELLYFQLVLDDVLL